MPSFMDLSVGTAMASTDWFVCVIDVAGVKTDVRIPKSLITGATVPSTKRYLTGDNAGNAIAEVVQVISGSIGTATINAGTNIVVISTSVTTPMLLVMPLLSGRIAAERIEIRDPGGFVSSTNTVSIIRQGGSDTVNGGATAVLAMNRPRMTAFVTANNALTDWGLFISNVTATGNLPAKLDGLGGVTGVSIANMGDANLTIPAGTNIVIVTAAFTAPRTATLPAASGYTIGDSIFFLDPNGFVGRVNCLNVIRGGTDTFNTLTSAQPGIYQPRGFCEVSLGTSTGWGFTGQLSSQDQQVFTASGTWTKPAGAFKTARVIVVGAGGGGGAGRKGAAASTRGGGGGGGSGGYAMGDFAFADLGSSVTVTVGVGGGGGAAQATNSTNGANGTDGGFTSFGNFVACSGGFAGVGGSATGGAGGAGSPYGFFTGDAGAAGGTGVAGVSGNAPSATTGICGAGGGGGGGINSSNTAFNGGAGGTPRTAAGGTAAAGGVAPGGAGSAALAPGASSPANGFGGAGGAGASGGAGGNGSAGTNGAGGGGGGAGIDAVGNSGAGGAGGNGICVVICYP